MKKTSQRPGEVEDAHDPEDHPRPVDRVPRVADVLADVPIAEERLARSLGCAPQKTFSMTRLRSAASRPSRRAGARACSRARGTPRAARACPTSCSSGEARRRRLGADEDVEALAARVLLDVGLERLQRGVQRLPVARRHDDLRQSRSTRRTGGLRRPSEDLPPDQVADDEHAAKRVSPSVSTRKNGEAGSSVLGDVVAEAVDRIEAPAACARVVRYCQTQRRPIRVSATTKPHIQASETQSTCQVAIRPSFWWWARR